MDIQKQIVITRARADYLSEQPDQVDTNMHSANADTMEKLLAALETIANDEDCEHCMSAFVANAALSPTQTRQPKSIHDPGAFPPAQTRQDGPPSCTCLDGNRHCLKHPAPETQEPK